MKRENSEQCDVSRHDPVIELFDLQLVERLNRSQGPRNPRCRWNAVQYGAVLLAWCLR